MKPAPKKIVWLMSVAGLGMSLGEAAHAKVGAVAYMQFLSDLERLREIDHAGLVLDSTDRASGEWLRPLDWAHFTNGHSVPVAAVDAAEVAVPLRSDLDLDIDALAMVLTDEPPRAAPQAAPTFVVRQLEIAPDSHSYRGWVAGRDAGQSGGARSVGAVSSTAWSDQGPGDADANEESRGIAALAVDASSPDLDLDLYRYLGESETPAPQRAIAPAPMALAVAIDVDLGADVDLLLPLSAESQPLPRLNTVAASPSVDIHLDWGPSLDINLDVPAVLDLNLDPFLRLDWYRRFSAIPTHTPTFEVAAASNEAAWISPPRSLSCESESASRRDAAAVEIVVASHADRVLRSLEALLTNTAASANGFGAQTRETFVSSEAERARLELADFLREGKGRKKAAVATLTTSITPAQDAVAGNPDPVRDQRQGAHGARATIRDGTRVVSESRLDGVRGGFVNHEGLQVSFGIERAVYINGSLVTTTSLNVSGLGAGATAAADVAARGSLLIQVGAGNVFTTAPLSAAMLGTVVQNTLDGQRIQSVTTVNAAVNSVQLLRSQALESSLRSAVIDSLRR